jgi:predicted RNase H-like HicB family nuclease
MTNNILLEKLLPENSKYFFEDNNWIIQTAEPDITSSGKTLEQAIQNYWAQWGMDANDFLLSDRNNELREYKRVLRFIAYGYIEMSLDKAGYQRDEYVKKAKEILNKYYSIASPPISIIERDF